MVTIMSENFAPMRTGTYPRKATMTRILIVEDEESYREPLVYQLTREGYDVSAAATGEEGLELFTKGGIDLVLLDLMLPGIDGTALCRRIREQSRVPIIMLTAKSAEIDKVVGLEIGADDYVTKPFNPLEVMARVKSLLRRSQHDVKNDEPDQIEIGPLIIKKDSHEVETVTGKSIQLTALEFGILYLLASHPNRVFSADEIFERVWQQESVVSAKTVMVHVSHLRDKIEESTGGEKVIQTVWGVGYKIESH